MLERFITLDPKGNTYLSYYDKEGHPCFQDLKTRESIVYDLTAKYQKLEDIAKEDIRCGCKVVMTLKDIDKILMAMELLR